MYEPTRGGTRGGQAEFKWSDVGADKDREHYLGHSINAPTGRWQKNKDVHWYNRDKTTTESERQAELAKLRESEKEAMAVALGYQPSKPITDGATVSGANAIPTGSKAPEPAAVPTAESPKLSKEEKKRLKAERKEEKRKIKEEERERRAMEQAGRSRRRRSRSASPRRRSLSPRRSLTPLREKTWMRQRRSPKVGEGRYQEADMERDRQRDRRRWEDNLARQEAARGNWDQ